MPGLRSFLFLLVVGLGLGGYIYFVESKRDPAAGDKKDKVFSVEADKIEEITVKAESGEQTTLRKSGSDWQIAAPVATQPDGAEVSGLTTNLSTLEQQRVIDEKPADLAEYGLAQPRIEIAFKAGGQEHRLQVGRKTPPGTDLYAKVASDPRVFLIPSYLEGTFNKTTFDLRDKTVLKVERDKIQSLTLTSPKQVVQFEKAGHEWKMIGPVSARADFSTVDSLVSRLNTLQMKSLVAAQAGLSEYGLDKPEATIQLGSGSSQATLIIGRSAGEGVVYAKDQSRPAVMTIDSTLVADATKEPGEYRQKDLFDARSFNSTRIEVARGADTVAFEKTKTKDKDGKEEEKWRQVAPTARDVDQPKVEDLIAAATGARATGFVNSSAKTGLDKPELTITIKSDDGKREEKVTMARTGVEGHAARAGEPGVAKIDIAAVENIVKALEALK
jgi:Domain of unknown function (DUF4340)